MSYASAPDDESHLRPGNPARLAVVLIHGIGDMTRGDVLESAIDAVGRSLPDLNVVTDEPPVRRPSGAFADSRVHTASADLQWHGHAIKLVEFHWASVAGKIRLRKPLQALRRLLEVLGEFPRMTAAEMPSAKLRTWAARAGRFQRWLVVGLLVLALPALIELALRPALPDLIREMSQTGGAPQDPELLQILGEALRSGYVATLGLAALYWVVGLYYGIGVASFIMFIPPWLLFRKRLRALDVVWRAIALGSVLTLAVALIVVQVVALSVFVITVLRHIGEPVGANANPVFTNPALFAMYMLVSIALGWGSLVLGLVVANLMRDAVHYLAADRDGDPLPNQVAIRSELWQLIEKLRADFEAQRIILVAHSLGTVIVSDLLWGKIRAGASLDGCPLDIVTAGSPLRRSIGRALPFRLPDPQTLLGNYRRAPLVVERWFNAYRLFDYVGQALTYFALPLDLVWCRPREQGSGGGIAEYLLKPRYQRPFGHADYWGDPRFLDFVVRDVVLPVLSTPDAKPQGMPVP